MTTHAYIDRMRRHALSVIFIIIFQVLGLTPASAAELIEQSKDPKLGCSSSIATPPGMQDFCPARERRAFRNPGKGWLPYYFVPSRSRPRPRLIEEVEKYDTPYASAILAQFEWRELEKDEGRPDWRPIQALIDRYGPRGRKIHLAIMFSNPKSMNETSTPDWYCSRSVAVDSPLNCNKLGQWHTTCKYFGPTDNCQNGETVSRFEPHYGHERYRKAVARFLAQFAQRLTADRSGGPQDWRRYIEAVEVSAYGHYGEWWSTYDWFQAEALATERNKYDSLRFLIDQFLKIRSAYEDMELVISAIGSSIGDMGTPGYSNALFPGDPSAIRYASQLKMISLYRKNIGWLHDPLSFPRDEEDLIRSQSKSSPVHTEWGSGDGNIRFFWSPGLPLSRKTTEQAIEQALQIRASHLGWHLNREIDSDFDSLAQTRSNDAGVTLREYFQYNSGYQFTVERVRTPQTVARGAVLRVQQWWRNIGVSGLFKRYYLKLYLSRSGSLVELKPVPRERLRDRDSISAALPAHTWPPVAWPPQEEAVPFEWSAEFLVPTNLERGSYELRMAIVDRWGDPAMNLAIKGKESRGITEMELLNNYGSYKVGAISVK